MTSNSCRFILPYLGYCITTAYAGVLPVCQTESSVTKITKSLEVNLNEEIFSISVK